MWLGGASRRLVAGDLLLVCGCRGARGLTPLPQDGFSFHATCYVTMRRHTSTPDVRRFDLRATAWSDRLSVWTVARTGAA